MILLDHSSQLLLLLRSNIQSTCSASIFRSASKISPDVLASVHWLDLSRQNASAGRLKYP